MPRGWKSRRLLASNCRFPEKETAHSGRDRRAFLKEACTMTLLGSLGTSSFATSGAAEEDTPRLEVVSDWQVRVSPGTVKRGKDQRRVTQEAILTVAPATLVRV